MAAHVREGAYAQPRSEDRAARRSIDPLTGSRFLAALWVVMYHYTIEFRFPNLAQEIHYLFGHRNLLDLILLQGHLAVDFFFLLSGFILVYTYVTADGTTRGGRGQFWLARVARIYPVYLLGLALGLGPYLFGGATFRDVLTSGVAHLLMVQSWFSPTLGWNQPSWSLSVEAFFYALFPLLLPLFARCQRRGLLALLVLSALAFALGTRLLVLLGNQHAIAALPWWRDFARYNPLISLPVFTTGMALGLLFLRHSAGAGSVGSAARRLGGRAFDIMIVGVAICFVAALVLLRKEGINGFTIDTVAPFALPFFAAFVYLLAFQRGAIARMLSLPIVIWLGEISYGIYILHAPLWDLLSHFAKEAFNMAPGNVLLIPVYALLVLTVSGLSFQYIERPARRAIRARWGQPQRVAVPSAA